MGYEPSYSRNQIHFISQAPAWVALLDSVEQFDSVLDLGSGGGRNSVFLRRVFPKAEITAIDISPIRCSACQDVADVEVVCGDALRLPFCGESFQLVISTEVIEHVPSDRGLVDEIERVLEPGGVSLVSSVIRMPHAWYFYRNRDGKWMLDPTHLREYRDLKQFAALFEDGFRITHTTTRRIELSPARFLYRQLARLGVICEPNPMAFSESSMGRLLSRFRVPIPRYRRVIVLAAKT